MNFHWFSMPQLNIEKRFACINNLFSWSYHPPLLPKCRTVEGWKRKQTTAMCRKNHSELNKHSNENFALCLYSEENVPGVGEVRKSSPTHRFHFSSRKKTYFKRAEISLDPLISEIFISDFKQLEKGRKQKQRNINCQNDKDSIKW